MEKLLFLLTDSTVLLEGTHTSSATEIKYNQLASLWFPQKSVGINGINGILQSLEKNNKQKKKSIDKLSIFLMAYDPRVISV